MLANFGFPGRMREDFKSMRSIFESVKFLKNNAALAVSLSLLAAVSAQASPGKNSAVISAGVPRAVSQAGAPAMVERYAAAPGAQLHLPIADARYLGAGHRAVYHQVPAVAARLFGQVRQDLTVYRQRPALAGRRRQY